MSLTVVAAFRLSIVTAWHVSPECPLSVHESEVTDFRFGSTPAFPPFLKNLSHTYFP